MEKLFSWLKNHHIIYVNRSFERAFGIDPTNPDFSIISNESVFAKSKTQKNSHILLIEATTLLNSWQLLEHPTSLEYIKNKKSQVGPMHFGGIIVYKPTQKIERICSEHNIPLLNPPTSLTNTIEGKISQVTWLEELAQHLPPHQTDIAKNLVWNYEPFILQFNQGHTGSSTQLIESEADLETIKKTFPERPVRTSAFVKGPTFTCNAIVSKDAVHLGPLSYQITGMAPFTNHAFATIGNDWELPHKILSYEQMAKIKEITHAVGRKMQKQGWRGAFGVDIITEQKTGNIYLLEINARQPASVTYESNLQKKHTSKSAKNMMTTFEAHIAALAGISTKEYSITPLKKGAQVLVRKTENSKNVIPEKTKKSLEKIDLTLIVSEKEIVGNELLRIQSEESLMQADQRFNEKGKRIVKIIQETL